MKSLKINFLLYTLRIGFSFLYPVITLPYVTRILGPENLGKVGLSTATIAFFIVLSAFGIPYYAVREIARHRDDETKLKIVAGELFILGIVTTLISYSIFLVVLFAVPRYSADKPLFLISSTVLLLSTTGVEWLYQGTERFGYITLRTVLFNAAALGGLFLFVKRPEDYYAYAALLALSSGGADLLNFLLARKNIQVRSFQFSNILKHLRPVTVLFGMNLARGIYTNADSIFLGLLRGDYDVGIYTTAQKFSRIVLMVLVSAGTVLLPRLSYYAGKEDHGSLRALSDRAIRFILLISIPSMFGMCLLSGDVIGFFAGPRFETSAAVLRIFSSMFVVASLEYFVGMQVLLPMGKERYFALGSAIGTGINLLLNVLLIPRMGSVGAAVAMVITEATILAYLLCHAPGYILGSIFSTTALKALTTSIAMLLVLIGLRKLLEVQGVASGMMLIALIPVGVIVYLIGLVIAKEDVTCMLLRRVWKKD